MKRVSQQVNDKTHSVSVCGYSIHIGMLVYKIKCTGLSECLKLYVKLSVIYLTTITCHILLAHLR